MNGVAKCIRLAGGKSASFFTRFRIEPIRHGQFARRQLQQVARSRRHCNPQIVVSCKNASVLKHKMGMNPAAAAHTAAAGRRSDDGPSGVAQPERLLADEHEQHRVSRAHERVVGQTRGSRLAGALERLSFPTAVEAGAESSGDVRGRVNTTEPPDADPHVRWCGGRRLITSGYPMCARHGSELTR